MRDDLPAVAILAGGLGTRLGALGARTPKVLVEVAGKPFIYHQLELLRRSGIRRVVLCVGHLGDLVVAVVGDGRQFGVDVSYSDDGERPLGTGGSLRRALSLLGEEFYVLYGDSYLEVDYGLLLERFRERSLLGLMTIVKNDRANHTNNVLFQAGQLVRYDKHTPSPAMEHIDYGLTILNSQAVRPVPDGKFSDLADLYRDLVNHGHMGALEVSRRFYEIGSPDGLLETSRYLEAPRDYYSFR